jgi:bacillithiol biosynthesis cysteine-adding enzyme BshC
MAKVARTNYHVSRELLVRTLNDQYKGLEKEPKLAHNIGLLLNENTFTVCTAHQPNLLTGYLYFIYKIVHAIRLADDLNKEFPHKNFVPVYYMGSEDNDLEELGTFRYNGKKFVWDGAGQRGAVGRMQTESLKPLLEELFKQLGPPGPHCQELQKMLENAYLNHETITDATRYLVNELFGRYGLIVMDPDNRELKRQFTEVMKDDLLQHTAYNIVTKQIGGLAEHYKVQAHPRPINLFYLKDDVRERIEKTGESWMVINTEIKWTEKELIMELEQYPERFSPNVILRGLYQESILPNVAFIGGGAEVAYWLQLKTLFEHYNVFYPSIHLRQSVMWVGKKENTLMEQEGLSVSDVFRAESELIHQYLLKHGEDDWQTEKEMSVIEQTLGELKRKATALDPTLRASAEATLAKIRHQVYALEKKMLRAEKHKMQTRLMKLSKLKALLFPGNGLQERVENFMGFYLQYGREYIDILKENMQPMRHEFLVVTEHETV